MRAALLFVVFLFAASITVVRGEEVTYPWYSGIGNTEDPFTAIVYDGDLVSWYMVDDNHTVTSVDAFNSTSGLGRYFNFGSPTAPLRMNTTTADLYINSSALPPRVYYYDQIEGFSSISAQFIVRTRPSPSATPSSGNLPSPSSSPSFGSSLSSSPSFGSSAGQSPPLIPSSSPSFGSSPGQSTPSSSPSFGSSPSSSPSFGSSPSSSPSFGSSPSASPSIGSSLGPSSNPGSSGSLSPTATSSPTVSPGCPTPAPVCSTPTPVPTCLAPTPSVCPPPPPPRPPLPNPACYLRPHSYAPPPLDLQINFYFADILVE